MGLGSFTRLLRFVTDGPKTYTAEVVLGTATTTLDDSGEPVGTWDMTGVTVADARRAAAGLTGAITQVPPMVSAIRMGGKRLHQLARRGEEVERHARPVTVDRFDVRAGAEPGVLAVTVTCSAGTYVRSLAADLGAALGGGAHLRRLRRRAVGEFTEEMAVALDDLGTDHVLSPARAVAGMAIVTVDDTLADRVAHGGVLARELLASPGAEGGPWAVVAPGGVLLAVYEAHGTDRAKPAVVVPGAWPRPT